MMTGDRPCVTDRVRQTTGLRSYPSPHCATGHVDEVAERVEDLDGGGFVGAGCDDAGRVGQGLAETTILKNGT